MSIWVEQLRELQSEDSHGVSIEIIRGQRGCALDAAWATKRGVVYGENGAVIYGKMSALLVVTADCVWDNPADEVAFTPQAGDQVVINSRRFTIAHPDGQSKPVDTRDGDGETLRMWVVPEPK